MADTVREPPVAKMMPVMARTFANWEMVMTKTMIAKYKMNMKKKMLQRLLSKKKMVMMMMMMMMMVMMIFWS